MTTRARVLATVALATAWTLSACGDPEAPKPAAVEALEVAVPAVAPPVVPPPAPPKARLASTPAPKHVIEPTTRAAATAEALERGRTLFARQCSACHGPEGKGDGEAAYLLYPKPRDFSRGVFRFTSTWEGTPTDDDLYRTISRGMPGSAMPSWAHLSESDRWALVDFVKSLAAEPLVVLPTKAPDVANNESGEGIVEVAPEPVDDAAGRKRGAELFQENCAPCHGPRGQGDGYQVANLKDDAEYPIRPRDLNTGVFKGPSSPATLYKRVIAGIPGTPMPANATLVGDDAWHLVHFVRSLSSDLLRERAEMKKFRIMAYRVPTLPDDPDAGAWNDIPPVQLHMMPLWWRYNRPEYINIQAVHDGKKLALLMTWSDDTHDEMVVRPQDFRDAAAVELALDDDPPFFAMGERATFVNIWMWKSDRQADVGGFHDVDMQYPNIGIDSYPNLMKSPYEQPMRNALTLDADPTFVTGWGAGNIVSDPTAKNAAEDLEAQGFGTLKARPPMDQRVRAVGRYAMGSYRVLMTRDLEGKGDKAATLEPGAVVPVAFAVWNGSAGDRNGRKSVTIWQELAIAE